MLSPEPKRSARRTRWSATASGPTTWPPVARRRPAADDDDLKEDECGGSSSCASSKHRCAATTASPGSTTSQRPSVARRTKRSVAGSSRRTTRSGVGTRRSSVKGGTPAASTSRPGGYAKHGAGRTLGSCCVCPAAMSSSSSGSADDVESCGLRQPLKSRSPMARETATSPQTRWISLSRTRSCAWRPTSGSSRSIEWSRPTHRSVSEVIQPPALMTRAASADPGAGVCGVDSGTNDPSALASTPAQSPQFATTNSGQSSSSSCAEVVSSEEPDLGGAGSSAPSNTNGSSASSSS
mmetsp:Transcript_3196/g.12216  ORF Transcript_3196/g.12216 Transcript_3196/m.12216 type:complete len:295 (+) Transcript_3196:526-1410(+)